MGNPVCVYDMRVAIIYCIYMMCGFFFVCSFGMFVCSFSTFCGGVQWAPAVDRRIFLLAGRRGDQTNNYTYTLYIYLTCIERLKNVSRPWRRVNTRSTAHHIWIVYISVDELYYIINVFMVHGMKVCGVGVCMCLCMCGDSIGLFFFIFNLITKK